MCVPYQYSCLRPSGRCRVKRSFSTTFSNSLYADLPQKLSSPALSEIPFRKVQAKVPFARHLLERSVRPSTHLRKVSRKSGKLTHLRKVEKACGVGKCSCRRSRGGGASTHLRKVSRKAINQHTFGGWKRRVVLENAAAGLLVAVVHLLTFGR